MLTTAIDPDVIRVVFAPLQMAPSWAASARSR
jgi:hypothetical protein